MACNHPSSAPGSRRWEARWSQVRAHRELERLELREPGVRSNCSMAPRNVAPRMAMGGPHFEDLELSLLELGNHQISRRSQGKSLVYWPAHALSAPFLPGCLFGCPFAWVPCRRQSPGKPCEVPRFVMLGRIRLPGWSTHLRRGGLPHE